ncbi:MAG: hypothetical protein ABEJ98_03685 [Candidatus Nanohaloarchaea archaeon]
MIAAAAVVAFVEFALPAITEFNGMILPLLQKNCGAAPEFVSQLMTVEEQPSAEGWRRTITCGVGGIIFLLVPGFLRFGSWLYRFLRR